VDIARSLYSQSDIYLYDDVLSAVDIHVGTSLMEDTILDYLKGKTIVMATHALKFASLADYIIFMKDGRVIACDKYQEISKIP
jgi:ABC-type transport system involved in cytochrome bd biosynthesis fused ATPase/permease subunit